MSQADPELLKVLKNLPDEQHDNLYQVDDLNHAQHVEETEVQFNFEPQTLTLARDYQVEENGASIAFELSDVPKGNIGIRTSAQAESRGRLETAQEFDYQAGQKAETGIRTRIPSTGGARYRWGYKGDGRGNGFYWEVLKSGEIRAVVERGGNRTVIPERFWSSHTELTDASILPENDVAGDFIGYEPFSLDSTLGNELDVNHGYVYKIDFTWYGQGIIVFKIVEVKEDGHQNPSPVCGFVPKQGISIEQPNQPLFAEAYNNGTPAQSEMYVTGRQVSKTGRSNVVTRPIRIVQESPDQISATSYTTLALIRRRSGFEGTSLDFGAVQVVGVSDTIDVEVRGRVDISGTPSFSTSPIRDSEDENPIEVDTTNSVATTNGELTGYPSGGGLVSSSRGRISVETTVDAPFTAFSRTEAAAVLAKQVQGSGGVTPDAVNIRVQTTV